ncbi:MAG: HlyC/CorC family transporter [Firmicutes bacterium]|nr:HlyC/CorC family transporter [Candidatus Colimorpha enterica]
MNATYIIIILIMVIFSAIFSATEISFNSSNKSRLKKAADEGDKTAALAYKISEDFTTALSAILIGNNLANVAASTAATVLAMDLLIGLGNNNDGLASVIATVVMTLIILIFGEIVPKILGKKNADLLVRYLAYPTKILTIILFPLVWVVMSLVNLLSALWGKDSENQPTVTEDELSSIIETVEEEGVIDEEQSELLQSAIDFGDTTVEEIMKPRIDMVAFDINDELNEITSLIDSSNYSRIPVYDDSPDEIIGVLSLNHYYKEMAKGTEVGQDVIRLILMKPLYVHKTMKLQPALSLMQEKKMHLAIVVDEFGGTMGIVSMEDILEELVGDIWDESDEIIPEFTKLNDTTYIVSGDMNIDDFFYEIEFEPDDFECEYSTMGGWAIEMLESNPHTGDTFVFRDVKEDEKDDEEDGYTELFIAVSEMDDMRVTKLTVLVKHVEPESKE